jgi:hypothetical protein
MATAVSLVDQNLIYQLVRSHPSALRLRRKESPVGVLASSKSLIALQHTSIVRGPVSRQGKGPLPNTHINCCKPVKRLLSDFQVLPCVIPTVATFGKIRLGSCLHNFVFLIHERSTWRAQLFMDSSCPTTP